MATFPVLSTGAVTQYPASITTTFPTEVVRFLDGSDQRFLTRGKGLRSWLIRLDLLTEGELLQIEQFFTSQQGEYSTFVFPDPFSGSRVPNCRLSGDEFITEYTGANVGAASFWVVETNG